MRDRVAALARAWWFGQLAVGFIAGAAPPTISGVTVSPSFFNPSTGQAAEVRFSLDTEATVSLTVLDRDNYIIRRLPPRQAAHGTAVIAWDGKDDAGIVVPDESYNVLIEATRGSEMGTYAPSRDFHPIFSNPPRSYAAVSGVLRYELDVPSRVHLQAGEAPIVGDPKLNKRDGPLLKTVVDRQPRTSGVVVETWDGYDESRTIHIPALKDFVLSVFAESLPPNALIAVGNRRETFRQYAQRRAPDAKPAYPEQTRLVHSMAHHLGLDAIHDFSPPISLRTKEAVDREGRVRIGVRQLSVEVEMARQDAATFLGPKSELVIFVDERPVARMKAATATASVVVPIERIPEGEHRIAANWISGHGPVAAQAVKVFRETVSREVAR